MTEDEQAFWDSFFFWLLANNKSCEDAMDAATKALIERRKISAGLSLAIS